MTFCGCAVLEQTFGKGYLYISKTFPKIWCKNIQPKTKKSYEGPKLMRLHLCFMLGITDYGTSILCGHETIGRSRNYGLRHGNGCNRIATRK